MDNHRYWCIQTNRGRLSPREVNEGWHFCPDWDQDLIGPSMLEWESCTCTTKKIVEERNEFRRSSLLWGVIAIAAACTISYAYSAPLITWVKISEPMDTWVWSQVDDITFVDRECKSDNTLPRVCLYHHLSKCRIIFTGPKSAMARTVELELVRMCQGYFPEPVLLHRKFSDPNYLPNQAAPSVDPVWKFQNAH